MALISVREYDSLHVGEFDPSGPSVTVPQADELTMLRRHYGVDIFKYVNRTTIKAQQYVGTIQFGSHAIEVLPKVEGEVPNVRRNLITMLAAALDLDIMDGDIARVATQDQGILEILIRLFCDKLFYQTHRGLVRHYEGQEANLKVLRGKMGIVEQTRLNAANPERLFCRFDEFQEDVPLNQILKAAIQLLLRVSRDVTNQKHLAALLLVFHDVSDCAIKSLPWARVIFDRLSRRFQHCFVLAELFLRRTPPDVSAGRIQGYSLFFDMNTLFEEYIGRAAARAFSTEGLQLRLQGPRHYLAFDEATKKHVFAMKPDVVAVQDYGVAWILDTKWKMLSREEAKEGVAQDDLYQMYAYSSCYDCDDVVLLYPHHAALGEGVGVRNSYALNPRLTDAGTSDTRKVRVATIDLRDLKSVPGQLKRLFSRTTNAAVAGCG